MENKADSVEEKFIDGSDVNAKNSFNLTWPGWGLRLTTLLLIALVVVLSIWALSPPEVEKSNAPLNEFSADRASKYLKVIGKAPHPTGSEAHKIVRDYIVSIFNELKLETDIQESTIIDENSSSPIVAATTHNVIAKLKGTSNSKAIMLVAHYDAVANSYGVSDDGAGVATLLETARALKSGTSLKNDIIFLITDAEELGLLGAKAFVNKNPLLKEVSLVFNFEARGSRGPVFMFETGANNGWLIRNLLQSTPRPISSSYMNEIYKIMPNDTDFSVFKRVGINGLNFAYIGGSAAYHSALDSMDSIDLKSVQHLGSYALSVTRASGNIDLNNINIKESDKNYFDILHTVLISYPNQWVIVQMILVFLLFIIVTIIGIKRKRVNFVGIGLGVVAPVVSIIASSSMVWFIVYAIRIMQNWRGNYYLSLDMPSTTLFVLAIVAFAIAINIVIYGYFIKKSDVLNLSLGATLIWLAMMLLVFMYVPGCSYLFTLPLLFNCIGLIYLAIRNNDHLLFIPSLLVTVCSLPGLLLWTPVVYGIFKAFGVLGAYIVATIVAILFGTIIYNTNLIATRRKWLLTSSFLFIGLSLFIAGKVNWSYFYSIRKANTIFYGKNSDNNSAIWGSYDRASDNWTKQFFKGGEGKRKLVEFFPSESNPFLVSTAPLIDAEPPAISVLSDNAVSDIRTIRLRIVSVRKAPILQIAVNKESKILSASINGESIKFSKTGNTQNGFWIQYYDVPENGLELVLETQPKPISIQVIDQSYGLPQNDKINFVVRPNNMMPSPIVPFSTDTTMVCKSFKL